MQNMKLLIERLNFFYFFIMFKDLYALVKICDNGTDDQGKNGKGRPMKTLKRL